MPLSPFSVVAFALALVPAIVAWWTGRTVLARVDDPVLPELLFARRRRLAGFTLGGGLALAFLFSDDALWALPLLWFALLVSAYPVRRRLFGERLSILAFLRYAFFSAVGQIGSWLLAAAAPAIATSLALALEPNDHAAATRIGVWAGLAFAAVVALWQFNYSRVFLALHRATPLRDTARPELMARLDAVLDRAAPALARRPEVYRYGAPGAYVMNALAIPSVWHPAVALGDTLLATLSDDEITAVFAHEVAHHEQFNSPKWRRMRWSLLIVVLLIAALPALVIASIPAIALAVTWAMPLIIAVALGRRVASRREDETASDVRAATLTGNGDAIVSALTKLHVYSRVPRRWPHAIESAATHPSLARRIQAVRETTAAMEHPEAQVATPLVAIRATTSDGAVVAFDRDRAYWFEGVAHETPLELHALRDAASSYRAVSYGDLTELRVGVADDVRSVEASDRDGRSWRVPIAPNDVPTVQALLDRVDIKLGRRKPTAASAGAANIRWLTLALLFALLWTGQSGVALVAILITLIRPAWSAAAAATAALAIGRVLANLRLVGWIDPIRQIALLATLCLAVVLTVQTVRRVRTDASRGNATRLARQAWTTAGILLVITVLMLAALAPLIVTRPASLIAHPVAISVATALFGAGAALFTIPNRWWRAAAVSLSASALACGVLLSGDGWLLRRSAPLKWSSPRLTAIGAARIPGGGLTLTASPNGRAFAVTQYQVPHRGQQATSRYVIGEFADTARTVRTSMATRVAFIDDETLLALDSAAGDSLEVRAERVRAPSGDVHVLWRERLPAIDMPELKIDRGRRAWLVVGRGDGDYGFTVITDTIGGVRPRVYRLGAATPNDVGEMMAQPLAAFPDGSALWTTLARLPGSGGSAMQVFLAMSFSPRWELRGTDGDGERFLADIDGFPRCATELDVRGTLCVEQSPNGVHVWRAASAKAIDRVTDLPSTLDLVHAESTDRIAATERLGQRLVVLDVGTREAFRLTLPGSFDRYSGRWTADVVARSGYVLVLTAGRDAATVTRYAIR